MVNETVDVIGTIDIDALAKNLASVVNIHERTDILVDALRATASNPQLLAQVLRLMEADLLETYVLQGEEYVQPKFHLGNLHQALEEVFGLPGVAEVLVSFARMNLLRIDRDEFSSPVKAIFDSLLSRGNIQHVSEAIYSDLLVALESGVLGVSNEMLSILVSAEWGRMVGYRHRVFIFLQKLASQNKKRGFDAKVVYECIDIPFNMPMIDPSFTNFLAEVVKRHIINGSIDFEDKVAAKGRRKADAEYYFPVEV